MQGSARLQQVFVITLATFVTGRISSNITMQSTTKRSVMWRTQRGSRRRLGGTNGGSSR